MNPIIDKSNSGRQWRGVVKQTGQNDCVNPLVDESIKELPEQRKNDVLSRYLEDWKRKKEKEVWRNAWNYKSIKNEKKNETTSPD